LADALLATPTTFLHGDWKMGNLGYRADGRVVLLDWDRPSVGAVTVDLAWYLAVNSDRIPEPKDHALARYRDALEQRGWATADWWDRQVTLALLGAFLQLGWSKGGQDEELAWWAPVVHRARRLLGD
jgi:aminoglycoside phosphotransferase (APT) family kinase protein